MKRYLPFTFAILAGVFAILYIQRRHVDAPASPQALLTAAADMQQEMTRMPAHYDHMTDADEIALGNALARYSTGHLNSIQRNPKQEVQVEAYLQIVGARTAAHARRKLPWTFHYISDPSFVNAFALPGGHVFIGQGLLSLMQSEDALAAVLGHEIEHIDLYHCAERTQTEMRLRKLGPLGMIASIPTELFMTGYSKQQELDADRDGTTLAVEAGYSYSGVLQLFESLHRIETQRNGIPEQPTGPINEMAHLSSAALSGYFASHPPAVQRTAKVREMAKALHWQEKPLQPIECSCASKFPQRQLRDHRSFRYD